MIHIVLKRQILFCFDNYKITNIFSKYISIFFPQISKRSLANSREANKILIPTMLEGEGLHVVVEPPEEEKK